MAGDDAADLVSLPCRRAAPPAWSAQHPAQAIVALANPFVFYAGEAAILLLRLAVDRCGATSTR